MQHKTLMCVIEAIGRIILHIRTSGKQNKNLTPVIGIAYILYYKGFKQSITIWFQFNYGKLPNNHIHCQLIEIGSM